MNGLCAASAYSLCNVITSTTCFNQQVQNVNNINTKSVSVSYQYQDDTLVSDSCQQFYSISLVVTLLQKDLISIFLKLQFITSYWGENIPTNLFCLSIVSVYDANFFEVFCRHL